ncbi:hypothetical protein [Sphingobium naphthae]|nr:hypothetical protein [Pseudomonadota bacterium]
MRIATTNHFLFRRNRPSEAQLRAGLGIGLLSLVLGTQLMWSLFAP